VVTVQPRLFVVEANQSRACLSVSERERRDIPVSVGALWMIDVLARYILLDDFVSGERVDKLCVDECGKESQVSLLKRGSQKH
jgi:hypothetical protein